MSVLNKCSKCNGSAIGNMIVVCPEKWQAMCGKCGKIVFTKTSEELIREWNNANPQMED